MAATNCGSILSKCSFTMHIKFCMRSLIGANAKLAKSTVALEVARPNIVRQAVF